MSDIFYVYAGTYEEALYLSQMRNIPISKFKFIYFPDQIRGLRNITIYLYGSYYYRKDYYQFQDICHYRQIVLEKVYNDK